MSQPATPTATPRPFRQQAGKCPACGNENLAYGSSELQDTQYSYQWHCTCGASGQEWHVLSFEGHVVRGQEPESGQLYTVIGEYWNNEQGYCETVRARDKDDACEKVQALVRASLAQEAGDEAADDLDLNSQPLRIWAIVAGNADLIYLHGVDEDPCR